MKEIIRTATYEAEYDSLSFEEIAPFIIPIVHQSLRKFIYLSPNLILKVIGFFFPNLNFAFARHLLLHMKEFPTNLGQLYGTNT